MLARITVWKLPRTISWQCLWRALEHWTAATLGARHALLTLDDIFALLQSRAMPLPGPHLARIRDLPHRTWLIITVLVRDVDALPPDTSLRHPERSALRHDHPTTIRTTRAVPRVALLVLRERRGQLRRAGQAVHLAFLE